VEIIALMLYFELAREEYLFWMRCEEFTELYESVSFPTIGRGLPSVLGRTSEIVAVRQNFVLCYKKAKTSLLS
jgi:formate-dependent phosphoribosylglycinamide formyltransferase (GAR transformylase)